MSALDTLMKRLGFIKLTRYGLVLTPEGRVMSMRPAVLDDGFGGKIVGWEDGDLAAAELESWRATKHAAPVHRVAVPLPSVTPPIPVATPIAVVPERAMPVTIAPVVAAPAPAMPTAPVAVASAPPEEDDWEWTIAIARARAAAEDTEVALAPPPLSPKPVPARPMPARPQTAPMPRVARGTPGPFPSHPGTGPRSTVIPVPSLPTADHARRTHVAPVVRSQRITRNLAVRTDLDDDTVPAITLSDPLEDTVPHLMMPRQARAVALPSIKRLGRA